MCKPPRRRVRGRTLATLLAFAAALALLYAGPASAEARAGGTPSTDAQRLDLPAARALPAGFAEKTVQLLGEGAVFAVGSQGFGWVLQAFGSEDKLQSEIAGIRDQLKEIQGTLNETLAATTQIRADLSQGTYSGLVAQTTPITASIDKGMEDLATVANMPAGDRTKKNFARSTLKFIGDKLMGSEQGELAKRVSGEALADGLIVAASKVAKTNTHYWTDQTSEQVREVFDYYQQQEVRLLVLRVEYMHTLPSTYSPATIKEAIEQVEKELGAQKTLLKPSPPPATIADTRTNLLWSFDGLDARVNISEASAVFARYASAGQGAWKLGSEATIKQLIQGWPGGNWGEFLNREAKEAIPALKGAKFGGVWTSAKCPIGYDENNPVESEIYLGPCHATVLRSDGVVEDLAGYQTRVHKGIVLEKVRPEDYWW
jgi:hypothetical protein